MANVACQYAPATLAMVLALAPSLAVAGERAPLELTEIDARALARTQVFETLSASGHRYRIMVALPEKAPPEEGFPVIYTLDANVMFGTMADAARAWARGTGREALVVGIGYPEDLPAVKERMRDLTPEQMVLPAGFPDGFETGGAAAFRAFLTDQLMPAIAARYRVSRHQSALFGHSLAGLFAAETRALAPEAFSTYLIASPSLWAAPQLLTDPASGGSDRMSPSPRVFVSVGEYEQAPDPDAPEPAERLAELRQVDNVRSYAARLARKTPGRVRLEPIAGENHHSVIPVAISRALRFFLARPPATQP